jgi:hypothetical protein
VDQVADALGKALTGVKPLQRRMLGALPAIPGAARPAHQAVVRVLRAVTPFAFTDRAADAPGSPRAPPVPPRRRFTRDRPY